MDARDSERAAHSFEELVVHDHWRKNVCGLGGSNAPEQMVVGLVPGRVFADAKNEYGRHSAAAISAGLWRSRRSAGCDRRRVVARTSVGPRNRRHDRAAGGYTLGIGAADSGDAGGARRGAGRRDGGRNRVVSGPAHIDGALPYTSASRSLPQFWSGGLDLRVLLFRLAAAVASGPLFGIRPAFSGTRVSLADTLREA